MNSIKAWVFAHARQLATLALWGAVMIAAHRWPAHTADVELVASGVALAVGIQLPPFKFSAQAVTKIISGALVAMTLVLVACTSRQVAKDAYYVEKEGCIQSYSTRAEQEKCLRAVDMRWNEAGAPPAASATVAVPFDGGTAVLQ